MTSVLYRDAALADARSDRLRLGVSILATEGRIAWIGPADGEDEPPPGCAIVDAGGTTIVPGMVDGHSHHDDRAEVLAHVRHHHHDAPGSPRARPGRLLPDPRRPPNRPHRHVARLARRLTRLATGGRSAAVNPQRGTQPHRVIVGQAGQ